MVVYEIRNDKDLFVACNRIGTFQQDKTELFYSCFSGEFLVL